MDPIISQIMLWGLNWAPQDWAECNGQTMNVQQNAALYSLLSITFGGNGSTTFQLPDFRGRTPIGYNTSLASRAMYNIGNTGGAETVQLSAANLPSHTHTAAATITPISVTVTAKASPALGTDSVPGTNGSTTLSASAAGRAAGSTIYNNQTPTVVLNAATATAAVSGGAVAVTVNPTTTAPVTNIDNRQPYLAVNFIIALNGIYPTRP